jgi:hypothetical protein
MIRQASAGPLRRMKPKLSAGLDPRGRQGLVEPVDKRVRRVAQFGL